jgi:hypothetical protein
MKQNEESKLDVFRFVKKRRYARIALLVGFAHFVFLALGKNYFNESFGLVVGMIGFTVCLGAISYHQGECNNCPICKVPFRKMPMYSDDNTGLPIFNSISNCPWCGGKLIADGVDG